MCFDVFAPSPRTRRWNFRRPSCRPYAVVRCTKPALNAMIQLTEKVWTIPPSPNAKRQPEKACEQTAASPFSGLQHPTFASRPTLPRATWSRAKWR